MNSFHTITCNFGIGDDSNGKILSEVVSEQIAHLCFW